MLPRLRRQLRAVDRGHLHHHATRHRGANAGPVLAEEAEPTGRIAHALEERHNRPAPSLQFPRKALEPAPEPAGPQRGRRLGRVSAQCGAPGGLRRPVQRHRARPNVHQEEPDQLRQPASACWRGGRSGRQTAHAPGQVERHSDDDVRQLPGFVADQGRPVLKHATRPPHHPRQREPADDGEEVVECVAAEHAVEDGGLERDAPLPAVHCLVHLRQLPVVDAEGAPQLLGPV